MSTIIDGSSVQTGSIDLTTPLATADGGSKLAQIVTYQTGAIATGTTVMPLDNTIPQNTEGDQYMSLSITPTNVNSTLEIDISILLSSGAANETLQMALFKNSIADALASTYSYMNTSSASQTLHLKHFVTSGSITPITFNVRAGGNSAGTTTVNGSLGGQLHGGVSASRITIKEYLP